MILQGLSKPFPNRMRRLLRKQGDISHSSISRSPSTDFAQQMTFRSKAMSRVPFSSVFYCSNPLAAALTRRRTQLFFFGLAIVANITEFWPLQLLDDLMLRKSKQLKFTKLESRSPVSESDVACTNSQSCSGPGISSFGVTMNGHPVKVDADFRVDGPSMIVDFKEPVEWNGWYFVTGDFDPRHDAVRFKLETSDGGERETVGSSSWTQVTVFKSQLCF